MTLISGRVYYTQTKTAIITVSFRRDYVLFKKTEKSSWPKHMNRERLKKNLVSGYANGRGVIGLEE